MCNREIADKNIAANTWGRQFGGFKIIFSSPLLFSFLPLEGKHQEPSFISCLKAVSAEVGLWVWPKRFLEKHM